MSADQPAPPDPQAWRSWPTPPGVPDRVLLDLPTSDAAERAAAMLAGAATATQDAVVDAVRLLATGSAAAYAGAAAQLSGIPEDELRRLVLAYRHGGTGGVSTALAATPCGAEDMGAVVDEVRRRRTFAAGELSVEPGHVADTGAGVLLRLGPDGRWYPFTLAREQWWPAPGASASAGTAYQAALRARTQRRASG